MKKALIVYGGWLGHQPEKCNEILTEMLEPDGYEIRSEYSTSAFAQDYVHEMDLIIPLSLIHISEPRDPNRSRMPSSA